MSAEISTAFVTYPSTDTLTALHVLSPEKDNSDSPAAGLVYSVACVMLEVSSLSV